MMMVSDLDFIVFSKIFGSGSDSDTTEIFRIETDIKFQYPHNTVAWPRTQPLGQSISLKFLLETRLESESFEALINFLAFLVPKL